MKVAFLNIVEMPGLEPGSVWLDSKYLQA